jgi:selenocysteine lyase/cysteine desulfurase
VTDDVWAAWRAARPPTRLVHLDSAAVGRSSQATLDAVAEHARLEAEIGGYVAEEHAEPQLTASRRDTADLLGTDAEGVAFTEGAMAALDALVGAWPLGDGATVLVAPSEWGPNLELLEGYGLRTEPVAVDAVGVIDLEALALSSSTRWPPTAASCNRSPRSSGWSTSTAYPSGWTRPSPPEWSPYPGERTLSSRPAASG